MSTRQIYFFRGKYFAYILNSTWSICDPHRSDQTLLICAKTMPALLKLCGEIPDLRYWWERGLKITGNLQKGSNTGKDRFVLRLPPPLVTAVFLMKVLLGSEILANRELIKLLVKWIHFDLTFVQNLYKTINFVKTYIPIAKLFSFVCFFGISFLI